MKWWNRLSYRLSTFIILLSIVPLAGFGITTINKIRDVRLQSIKEIQTGIAERSASEISSSISSIMLEIQLFAESNDLDRMSESDRERFLPALVKALPTIYTLTLADASGHGKAMVGPEAAYSQSDLGMLTNFPVFQKDGAPIIGGFHTATNNLLLLDLYIPILSPMERLVTAVLKAEIDVEKLIKFIADQRVGKTGYVYVVNAEGKILVHPDQSVVAAGENRLDNPLVQDFVSGRMAAAANARYTNRQQKEVLTNAQAIAKPKLLVVVAQPVDEALANVTLIRKRQVELLSFVLIVAMLLSLYFTVKIIKPLRRLESGAQLIGAGNFTHRIPVISPDELGMVTRSFNVMAAELQTAKVQTDEQNWLKQGIAELDELLRGDQSLENICANVITFMATYLKEQVGLIYAHDGQGTYRYVAGFAFKPGKQFLESFSPGEGLCGQAVREKRILDISGIPNEYISIASGLGSMIPKHLSIVPFVFNDKVEAVMELGSLHELNKVQRRFLTETAGSVAVIIASARSRFDLKNALINTRQQAEELQRQQEELQASNEEMEEQTQLLISSESRLKEQQEELQAANEELEEKTQYLERNKKNIEEKNQTLEQLRKDLEKKAKDLAIASKYKSEFLANMSHELRTPLNSVLLLARLLAENKEKNLSSEQVDSAQIIYNSGSDLLSLIDEILDLSKIEAGKMQLRMGEVTLAELGETIEKNFKHLVEEKGLYLHITIRDTVPLVIVSDRQRLEQILKNFISNALKFTAKGGITIEFYLPSDAVLLSRPGLDSQNTVAIAVRDTGIGIPSDKQKIIFEAFQQVDGGTSRKYGGTGLGLSISRELARLLGGEIQVQSVASKGSAFTLFLPRQFVASTTPDPGSTSSGKDRENTIEGLPVTTGPSSSHKHRADNWPEDDRNNVGPDDKTILIIEDDVNFARTLSNFCREKGFKSIVSSTGEEGLECAEKYPLKAIILDIHLPGIDGWTVLETLKDNPSTRHIPVQFMSVDDPVPAAFTKGAVGYMTKPVSREDLEKALLGLASIINKQLKDLLLVEDNADQRSVIARLIGNGDVAIKGVATGTDALAALKEKRYDCMILDLGLPDMSGFDLLKNMERDETIVPPPIVVYTGRELTRAEEHELRKYSESIIIKGVRSEERLLDETSLFLHRMVEKLPEDKRKIISALHDTDHILRNRTILIVDDDMRNVFALSKVLNDKGINTLKAENGLTALEILGKRNDVDLVLMDIMMPVMDGYETMRKIRAESRFDKLPIIALTAKAMQRDKDDCIAAGASDYLAKPVDMSRLLSMMRVWLYK